MNETEIKLENAYRDSLSLALSGSEEVINKLDDIRTVAGWYREAKEDPKKIPKIIVNRLLEEILNYSKEHFINSINESIELQCQINEQHQFMGTIRVNLKTFKPYVEFIKVVNGKEVPPSLRFTFRIEIDGTLEGLKFGARPTVSVGQVGNKREINVDKFGFDLTISIIKLPALKLVVPIYLYQNQHFKVKDLHFYL